MYIATFLRLPINIRGYFLTQHEHMRNFVDKNCFLLIKKKINCFTTLIQGGTKIPGCFLW